ncbi:hypothetical protein GGR53DRAFT_531857 [Hypoxylon sp. FL1150]|nr:hypothetical protein GGR53DRAFT_531857 [Hypoxylon sp. FL1150]
MEMSWWQELDFSDVIHITFVARTTLLIVLVVGASYAGASVLLAAYLAGIVVSWWQDSQHHDSKATTDSQSPEGSWSVVPSHEVQEDMSTDELNTFGQSPGVREGSEGNGNGLGPQLTRTSNSNKMTRIPKPFFFASIGFSIPISDMFSGGILWRWVIYSILMAITESDGMFHRPSDDVNAAASGLFLIITWAIILCTVISPIPVDLLARKVKKLDVRRAQRIGVQ